MRQRWRFWQKSSDPPPSEWQARSWVVPMSGRDGVDFRLGVVAGPYGVTVQPASAAFIPASLSSSTRSRRSIE